MEDYDFDPNAFSESAQRAQDANLVVQFYSRPVKDNGKTEEAGRPIFIDMDYVKIIAPGNATNIIDRPVDDVDRARFRDRYNAWKAGESNTVQGTLLSEWPAINRTLCEELRFFQLLTVEQLAAAPDNLAPQIQGFYGLKQQAADYIAASKVLSGDVVAKVKELLNEVEELRKTVVELKSEKVSANTAKVAPKA